MIKKLLCLLFFFLSLAGQAQIEKVEHFFVTSPHAEKLFHFFKDSFRLPVLWKFQTWTDFASGGVSLGNVAFEFVWFAGDTATRFAGIAFEPRQSVEELMPELDKHGIAHNTIQHNTSINASGVRVGWSNMGLMDLLPAEANSFICDYANREAVSANRKKGADSLLFYNGGPLGIESLREMVIATNEFEKHAMAFPKLPGVIKTSGDLFSFRSGPSIRLKKATTPSFEKIVIKVTSLAEAKRYLAEHNWLGRIADSGVFINPDVIEGLQIELVE